MEPRVAWERPLGIAGTCALLALLLAIQLGVVGDWGENAARLAFATCLAGWVLLLPPARERLRQRDARAQVWALALGAGLLAAVSLVTLRIHGVPAELVSVAFLACVLVGGGVFTAGSVDHAIAKLLPASAPSARVSRLWCTGALAALLAAVLGVRFVAHAVEVPDNVWGSVFWDFGGGLVVATLAALALLVAALRDRRRLGEGSLAWRVAIVAPLLGAYLGYLAATFKEAPGHAVTAAAVVALLLRLAEPAFNLADHGRLKTRHADATLLLLLAIAFCLVEQGLGLRAAPEGEAASAVEGIVEAYGALGFLVGAAALPLVRYAERRWPREQETSSEEGGLLPFVGGLALALAAGAHDAVPTLGDAFLGGTLGYTMGVLAREIVRPPRAWRSLPPVAGAILGLGVGIAPWSGAVGLGVAVLVVALLATEFADAIARRAAPSGPWRTAAMIVLLATLAASGLAGMTGGVPLALAAAATLQFMLLFVPHARGALVREEGAQALQLALVGAILVLAEHADALAPSLGFRAGLVALAAAGGVAARTVLHRGREALRAEHQQGSSEA